LFIYTHFGTEGCWDASMEIWADIPELRIAHFKNNRIREFKSSFLFIQVSWWNCFPLKLN